MRERLAVHGGRPVRSTSLPYCRQAIAEDDVQAVVAALRSDWLTTGPQVTTFERSFASTVGVAHAVAVSSGTAALHAAVVAAGTRPGDEVVTSPLSFVASANAVLYCGAVPVFADIRPDTLCMDPREVETKLMTRTRVVLPVDFAGHPCELDAILDIAESRGLAVIEDAAHALGAEYKGRRVGGLADMTVFSLHPAKAITTGEGGVVTTDREDLATRLRRFRNHGFEVDHRERNAQGRLYSPMTDLGYNYRLTDLQCALGLSQLGKLEHFLKRRAEIADRYAGALGDQAGVMLPRTLPEVRHAWHIFPILLDLERLTADRGTILAALRAENIGAVVHYVPVYWHPYYERLGYRRGLCPRAEAAFERIVTLPLFPAMSDADADDVVCAVRKVLGYYLR